MTRRKAISANKPTATRASRSKNAIAEPLADEAASLKHLLTMTSGALHLMLETTFPKDLRGMLRQAESYAKGECDLIQAIIRTKMDFYSVGFDVQVKTPNENNKGNLRGRIGTMIRTHELRRVASELMFDQCATDNSILQWAVEDGELQYVTSISPSRVEYLQAPGKTTLKVELAEETKLAVNNVLSDSRRGEKEARRMYPDKYVDAVRRGDRYVELSEKDGEYWVVRANNRRFAGLARPSMFAIFSDVLLRKLIESGDWAVAFFLKRIIEHIKSGESPPPGNVHQPRVLYPRKEDVGLLRDAWRKLGQTLRIFTDHTVKVEFPHPDPEVFHPVKYEKVEERILRWGRIPDVLMTGKGEGFSQGHLGARAFIAHGWSVRETVSEMIETFLLHESVREVLSIPVGSRVVASWDEQVMKDPKQVLEEINAAWDRGALDVQTYHNRLGMPHEAIRAGKEEDAKNKKLWVPTFEPRQGLLSNDGAGRPDGGGAKPAPTSRPKPTKTRG